MFNNVLKTYVMPLATVVLLTVLCPACKDPHATPTEAAISGINLKRGSLISCGNGEMEYGKLQFPITGGKRVNEQFNLGVKLLHSFEYGEAEKVFANLIDSFPGTAMAYWGVAMSNFHPLWTPPSEEELLKGSKALEIGHAIPDKSKKEKDYINAIGAYYVGWQEADHRTRTLRFEHAMEKLYLDHQEDKEAAIFYALALTAAADPTDQRFKKQKKAGELLTSLYPGQPTHPGIVHYIIHTYDSPPLAELALGAARKYASVAPSSAHALHMPSHIFTRLGLWDESIQTNLASVDNAQCYAQASGIKGHWDEELHGLDYLVYAYLQKGDNEASEKYLEYLQSMKRVEPLNFKVAYAFAAIPSRYYLENKLWAKAAQMEANYAGIDWKKFPWQNSIVHATRMMGSLRSGATAQAGEELKILQEIHRELLKQKNAYQARQVEIKIKTGEAWISMKKGDHVTALRLMSAAADMEDEAEKHPVTPGEVIPAREYLADMLLQLDKPAEALAMYEADLVKNKNRFNALSGAARAASRIGDQQKATAYYKKLIEVGNATNSSRPELKAANDYLGRL